MFRRIFILSVGLVLVLGFVGSDLQANHETVLVVRVMIDFDSFDSALATLDTMSMPPSTGLGRAFYVSGRICKNKEGPCDPGGNFHCWGWQTDPFSVIFDPETEEGIPGPSTSVVSQIFEIDGLDSSSSDDDSSSSDDDSSSSDDDRGGSIMVSGVEAFGDNFVNRAVTGGTGRFRNVTGEMTDAQLDANELIVTFRLSGVD